MIRVIIKNYKSIRDIDIDIEGYTAFLAPNFMGKSATLSAIGSALRNRSGTDFITTGEKFCEVRVIFDKPELKMDILWHKEEGNNFYVIDGVKYDKVGNGPPPKPIIDAGLTPFFFGDKSVNFHFAAQNHPLFLVHEQDKDYVTDLLAMIYKVDVLYKAGGLAKKGMREANSVVNLREKDVKAAELAMRNFDGLNPAGDMLTSVEALVNAITDSEEKLGELEALCSDKDRMHASISAAQEVNLDIFEFPDVHAELLRNGEATKARELLIRLQPSVKCSAISDVPEISDIEPLVKKLSTVDKLNELATRLQGVIKAIKSAPALTIPEIPEVDGFYAASVLSDEYESLSRILGKLPKESMSVADIDPGIESGISRIDRVEQLRSTAAKVRAELLEIGKHALDVPDIDMDLSRVEELEKLAREMATVARSIKDAESELEKANAEMSEIISELSEFKTCPTCGGGLDEHEH